MEYFIVNGKGQATIEFLLTLVVALMFIVTIIQPNANFASAAVNDTSNIAKLKISAEKLSQAIQYASVSGTGTKQTIQMIIPQDGNILCSPAPPSTTSNDINFMYLLKSGEGVTSCEVDDDNPANSARCKKKITPGAAFKCIQNPVVSGIYKATVTKVTTTPNIEVAFELIQ